MSHVGFAFMHFWGVRGSCSKLGFFEHSMFSVAPPIHMHIYTKLQTNVV